MPQVCNKEENHNQFLHITHTDELKSFMIAGVQTVLSHKHPKHPKNNQKKSNFEKQRGYEPWLGTTTDSIQQLLWTENIQNCSLKTTLIFIWEFAAE